MDLQELGRRVQGARLARKWGKEQAAREAGISSITWKRVEDGLSVQEAKLQAVLDAVGLDREGGAVVGGEGEASSYVAAPGDRATVTLAEDELEEIIRDAVERARRLDRS